MNSGKLEFDLFYELLRIRRIEEAIADRYSEEKMRCPMHLSIGQEGVAVGVCKALEKEDMMISHHRCHAHYLAKGGSLKKKWLLSFMERKLGALLEEPAPCTLSI